MLKIMQSGLRLHIAIKLVGLLSLAYMVASVYWFLYFPSVSYPEESYPYLLHSFSTDGEKVDENIKYILYWIPDREKQDYRLGFGSSPFQYNLCPETRCFTTQNRSLKPVEEFDAIFFERRDLDLNDIPARRLSHQRYIYFTMESPSWLEWDRIKNLSAVDNFFNWTMTYRLDSDFPRPYGRVFKNKDLPSDVKELDQLIQRFGSSNQALAAGKSKFAAWFVSACSSHSNRNQYAELLNKFVSVDIYGACGPLDCPKKEEKCYDFLDKDYMFYLSFENSVCKDYVTEKLFHVMKNNVIPVVLNGVDMAYFAPPHSYIDIRDFESVESLSRYLVKVSQEPALYASYFWWREFYQIRESWVDINQSWCSLCEALHNNSEEKVYSDLHSWWYTTSNCTEPSWQ